QSTIPPPDAPADGTKNDADDECDGDRKEPDLEGEVSPREKAAERIATKFIGSHEMTLAWRQQLGISIHDRRVVRRADDADDGSNSDDHEQDHTNHHSPMAGDLSQHQRAWRIRGSTTT